MVKFLAKLGVLGLLLAGVGTALLLSGCRHIADDHCSACDKDGKIKVRVRCKRCGGEGYVPKFYLVPVPCKICKEWGYLYKDVKCPICYGTKNKNTPNSRRRIFYE